jgi:hypothetical protein
MTPHNIWGIFGLGAGLILAYLLLHDSGGLRGDAAAAVTAAKGLGGATSGLVKTFQGRA